MIFAVFSYSYRWVCSSRSHCLILFNGVNLNGKERRGGLFSSYLIDIPGMNHSCLSSIGAYGFLSVVLFVAVMGGCRGYPVIRYGSCYTVPKYSTSNTLGSKIDLHLNNHNPTHIIRTLQFHHDNFLPRKLSTISNTPIITNLT